MSVKAFFDTNILVYAVDKNEPAKSAIAKQLVKEYGSDGNLTLSTQVLQELYVTLTRLGKLAMDKEDAESIVKNLSQFPLINIDKTLILKAMKRHQGLGFSFWDGLIVEAALYSGCQLLLSEDMHHGLVIDGLTINNPFHELKNY